MADTIGILGGLGAIWSSFEGAKAAREVRKQAGVGAPPTEPSGWEAVSFPEMGPIGDAPWEQGYPAQQMGPTPREGETYEEWQQRRKREMAEWEQAGRPTAEEAAMREGIMARLNRSVNAGASRAIRQVQEYYASIGQSGTPAEASRIEGIQRQAVNDITEGTLDIEMGLYDRAIAKSESDWRRYLEASELGMGYQAGASQFAESLGGLVEAMRGRREPGVAEVAGPTRPTKEMFPPSTWTPPGGYAEPSRPPRTFQPVVPSPGHVYAGPSGRRAPTPEQQRRQTAARQRSGGFGYRYSY